MNGGARRLWLVLAVGVMATLMVAALCSAGGPPRVAGQPQPSLTPESQVTIPGGRSLAPGEDVTFVQPPPAPTPTPVAVSSPGARPLPIPRARFSPVPLHVTNASPGRVFVSLGAPDFTVTAFDDVLVQLQVAYPGGFTPGGPPGLSFCGADDARGNVVRCRAMLGTMGPAGPLDVTVTSVAADTATQTATLSTGESVYWVRPWSADSGSDVAPALAVASTPRMQPVAAAWDGGTLTLAAPDGYAVRASAVSLSLPPEQSQLSDACAPSLDDPTMTSCALTGLPQATVNVSTVPLAPTAFAPLSYEDRFGAGTLQIAPTGPEAAPGGESADVAIAAGGRTLSGHGVVRPGYSGAELDVSFQLVDSSGAQYLYVGSLQAADDGYAGRGAFLGLARPHLTGEWTIGEPDRAASLPLGEVTLTYTTRGPDDPNFGFPGLGLPALADTLVEFGPPGMGVHTVGPPVIAVAGQTIGLQAITTSPLVGDRYRYDFDFGDGAVDMGEARQTVPHRYAAPGVYTVVIILTDASGVQTFGATQIAIGPAS